MTTATTLGDAVFSLNMTRGEDALYKMPIPKTLPDYGVHTHGRTNGSVGSGAIVAAIVVVVIIIVTLVLILLKMYNRRMRTRRELEPKSPKPPVPPALDPSSNGSQQPATVTFDPANVHVETR